MFGVAIIVFSITTVQLAIADGLSPDSPTAKVLLKYPEGRKCLADISSGGKFADVTVVLMNQSEIEKKAGHDGGGVRQNPDSKKYEILVNRDLTIEQRAHAIAHELQHIRDEIAFDNYLESHPSLNAIGPAVIRGLKSTDAAAFIAANRAKTQFVLYGLFCQERRAYQRNIVLHEQGLAFANTTALETPGEFIARQYVSKFGYSMSSSEISDVERKCLKNGDFAEFMDSIAPSSSSKSPGPNTVVQ